MRETDTLAVVLVFCLYVLLVTADPIKIINYSTWEELPRLTQIGDNIVTDGNLGEIYGSDVDTLQFSLQSSVYKDYFIFHANRSEVLLTNKVIDRDHVCPQMVTCKMVLDVGILSADMKFEVLRIVINVIDINDNAPEFSDNRLDLTVSESASAGTSILLPTAQDPDSGSLGIQSYELLGGGNVFSLVVTNNTDGSNVEVRLVLLQELDRESRGYYALQLVARDGGSPYLSGSLPVSITVLDANDNNPVFYNMTKDLTYQVEVAENTPIGTSLIKVLARDPDEGPNGEVLYKWGTQTARMYGSVFSVHNVTGVVSLKGPLDYESVKVYHLQVTAYDKGASGVPSQAKVIVQVTDVNDHPPVITVNAFASTSIEVPENADAGGFVAHVSIEDEDSGVNGEVTCGIGQGPFSLEPLDDYAFTIKTTEVLDREQQDVYEVSISCSDKGQDALTTEHKVIVQVTDQNDHTPHFTQKIYNAILKENRTINIPILQVIATDEDIGANGKVTYRLQGVYADRLKIDTDSGLLSTAAAIDYEQLQQLQVIVIASDSGSSPLSSNATVSVTIVDENDEYPVFLQSQYDIVIYENKTAGTEVGSVMATDADSAPFNEITYGLAGNAEIFDTFIINPKTGKILLKKSLDREYKAKYEFAVIGSNAGYPGMETSVPIIVHVADINDNAPTLVFPTPSNNTIHVSHHAKQGYYFARVEAQDADVGHNAKLTYSFARASPGDLFDIDSFTGALSLKADLSDKQTSMYSLMITVRDSGSPPKSAVAELNVVVNMSLPSPYPADPGLPPAINPPSSSSSGTLTRSETILISLAMVTLLLVTILIVAIVFVKRRQVKDDDDDMIHNGFNVTDDLSSSTGSSRTKTSTTNDLNSSSQTSEQDSYDAKPRKEVTFDINTNSIDMEFQTKHNIRHYDYPNSTLVTLQNNLDKGNRDSFKTGPSSRPRSRSPSAHALALSSQAAANQAPRHRLTESPSEVISKPWNLTKKELAVHHLVHRMTTPPVDDSDSASGCSADMSNTDSGRGPSEDGDRTASPPPDPAGADVGGTKRLNIPPAPVVPPRRTSSLSSNDGASSNLNKHTNPPNFNLKDLDYHYNPSKHKYLKPDLSQLRNQGLVNPKGLSHKNDIQRNVNGMTRPDHRHKPSHSKSTDRHKSSNVTRPLRPHRGEQFSKSKYSKPRGAGTAAYVDSSRAFDAVNRHKQHTDYTHSLDRASSVADTVEESDSGSTTSGEYTLDSVDGVPEISVDTGHVGTAGSFV